MHYVEDKFDFFDLNAGCPANNIIRQGAGADLMQKQELLLKMLNELIKNTNKPITLKYRLGINEKKENFKEIGKKAEDIGVSMITLHARYANQGYSGNANWDKIKELKESLNIPITGNGDVRSPEDAKRMTDKTNCDYVMIGRWAIGNPFCFKQVNDFFNKKSYKKTSDSDKLKAFLVYLENAKKYNVSFARIKIQAMQFSKGIKSSVELRTNIASTKNENELMKEINSFLKK